MHRAIKNLILSIAFAFPLLAQGSFTWKDLGNGRLELSESGKPALVYNYGIQWKEGAPDDRRRCCYIFPLYTPAGVSVLDDFPPDHWHHRGIFWSWPDIQTEGKTYDNWMKMTAKHRSARTPITSVDAAGAHFETLDFWQAGDQDFVREKVLFTVFPAANGARELELELTWEAVTAPVTLRGSREQGKSYGGLSTRFAPRQGTVLRADGEVIAKDEDLNPRKWAELEGVYNGRKAILRITPDPQSLGTPYQWCLRNYGFVGASFPGRTATSDGYTLQPGKPITLKFRVRVSDAK